MTTVSGAELAPLTYHHATTPAEVHDIIRQARVHGPIAMGPYVAGVVIPAGTLVVANTAAANRDPAVYEVPERFDVHRQAPPPMVGFGGGLHYCLGVHLARIELAEALRVVTATLRHPRHAGPHPWKPMTGITGPATLPLAFDAA